MHVTIYKEGFIPPSESSALFGTLKQDTVWDERVKSRKTASYGLPYDYSGISYPITPIPEMFLPLLDKAEKAVGFRPNNILLNWYYDDRSKMGYHSVRTDILEEDCGIVIISLGDTARLDFRWKDDKAFHDSEILESGSLFYMGQERQEIMEHALSIPDFKEGRVSITLRRVRE